ncbi:MAG: 3'-5' exonuclease [Candidatus Pacebacteria bacterium]|nr:3'-5' exonuclease [Candidatus Paceibacterota bacterium]
MIVVDVETTGTNPEKHSILSIGALNFDAPEQRFYGECRAWDGAHAEEEALKINGATLESIHDPKKQSEHDLVMSFIEWARTAQSWNFVGQNPSFDLAFVAAACHRTHIEFPFPHRSLDTHTMAYMHLSVRGKEVPMNLPHHRTAMNLDFILRYVGIPEEPKPHNALTGALCHAEVASRLMFGKKLLPEFELYPILSV